MNIDRIARAMTGGRARDGFTARVMAPIYGRPQPGFTARVMLVAQGFSPANAPAAQAFRPAMAAALLIPAAIALTAGVMIVRASRVDLPAAPVAPRLATAPAFDPNVAQAERVAQAFRPANRRRAQLPAAEPEPEPAQIYMIDALEAPAEIAMKSIGPLFVAVPPLAGPAPLTIPELRNSKEKS